MTIIQKFKDFSRTKAFGHLLILSMIVGPLILSRILEPMPTNVEESVTLFGVKLPPICSMKRNFNLPCPGCGLTRSWVSAAHGQYSISWEYHRMGMLLMIYAIIQALRHGFWLAKPSVRTFIDQHGRKLDLLLIPFVILLMLNWGYNMYILFR